LIPVSFLALTCFDPVFGHRLSLPHTDSPSPAPPRRLHRQLKVGGVCAIPLSLFSPIFSVRQCNPHWPIHEESRRSCFLFTTESPFPQSGAFLPPSFLRRSPPTPHPADSPMIRLA
jgi:hypothetical protein